MPLTVHAQVALSNVAVSQHCTMGWVGGAVTVREKVADEAAQGIPSGLLVVTVMVTLLPPSPAPGV